MELENSYTTSELEDILEVKIERTKSSADLHGRALGSTTSNIFYSIIEITINLPLSSKYLDMSYSEKVILNKLVYEQVLDNYPNVVEDLYFVENTKRGHPHIHGYFKLRWEHPIFVKGLLMDIAKLVLKRCLSRGQYNKQYDQANYSEKLERFKSPALCLNYKRVLSDKWLSYIKKSQST